MDTFSHKGCRLENDSPWQRKSVDGRYVSRRRAADTKRAAVF